MFYTKYSFSSQLDGDRNTLKEALADGSDQDHRPPDPLAPDA
jgi:hypothetical protein